MCHCPTFAIVPLITQADKKIQKMYGRVKKHLRNSTLAFRVWERVYEQLTHRCGAGGRSGCGGQTRSCNLPDLCTGQTHTADRSALGLFLELSPTDVLCGPVLFPTHCAPRSQVRRPPVSLPGTPTPTPMHQSVLTPPAFTGGWRAHACSVLSRQMLPPAH